MDELKDQIIERLEQAMKESNLDSIFIGTNLQLIGVLTRLLEVIDGLNKQNP